MRLWYGTKDPKGLHMVRLIYDTAPLCVFLTRSCRHFTPTWFAVNMGTGAISVLFHNYPYANNSTPMKMFAYIFFFLNLALFLVFNIMTAARYIMFPGIWTTMIRHPMQSLYIGCYPMGAATLINIGVDLIYREYNFGGRKFLYFLWACWWVDVVISLVCAFTAVHIMYVIAIRRCAATHLTHCSQ